MVDVICDSSFLMLLGSKKIKNIEHVSTEIGSLEFLVPDTVYEELERIAKTNDKKKV